MVLRVAGSLGEPRNLRAATSACASYEQAEQSARSLQDHRLKRLRQALQELEERHARELAEAKMLYETANLLDADNRKCGRTQKYVGAGGSSIAG